jgi:exopolysaccharide production protein ExoQ
MISTASTSPIEDESLHLHSSLPSLRMQDLATFITGTLVCLVSIFNTVDINQGLTGHVGLDSVVLIKIVLAGGCGAIGLLGFILDPVVRKSLLSTPGILLTMLAIVFLVTSIFALPEMARICQVAAVINCFYLLFIPTAIRCLGIERFLNLIIVGLAINLLAGWAIYIVLPSVGVFEEELANKTIVPRMGGLGHPNAVGRIGIFTVMLATARMLRLKGQGKDPGIVIWLMLSVLGIASVFAASSRTALVAGGIALGFLMIDRMFSRAGATAVIGSAALVLLGGVAMAMISGNGLGSRLVSAITKTGDINELTSATGRTDIWAEAVRLIAKKPFTGYGLNSSPALLEDFSYHTHNMVLHAAFSGGLLAGLLAALCLLWNFAKGLSSEQPIIRGVSMFTLVSSNFEDTVLETFAGPSTVLWIAVMLIPALHYWEQAMAETLQTKLATDGLSSVS